MENNGNILSNIEIKSVLNILDGVLQENENYCQIVGIESCLVDTENSLIFAVNATQSGVHTGIVCLRSVKDDIACEDMVYAFLDACFRYEDTKLFWFSKNSFVSIKNKYTDLSCVGAYSELVGLVKDSVKDRIILDQIQVALNFDNVTNQSGKNVLITSL